MRRLSKSTIKIFIIGIIMLAYLARDVMGISVPEVFFISICGFAFFYLDLGASLGVYIFTSTLILPGNPIRLLYLLFTVYKLNSKRKLIFPISMMIIIFIQFIEGIFWSSGGLTTALYDDIQNLLYIVIPVLWMSKKFKPEDVKKSVLFYIVGTMFAYSIILFMTVTTYGWAATIGGTIRLGSRLANSYQNNSTMISAYNPNGIATTSVLAIGFLLILIETGRIKKLLGYSAIFVFFVFILLTKSRTGILTLILLFILYYIYIIVNQKKIFRGFLLLFLVGLGTILSVYLVPEVWTHLLMRFVDQEDLSNGRLFLNMSYLNYWLSHIWCFLFGYGMGNYSSIVNIGNSAHNAIVDVLMTWGIVGMGLLISFMKRYFKTSISYLDRKHLFLSAIPVLVYFIALQGGQLLTVPASFVRLCFAILFMRCIVY